MSTITNLRILSGIQANVEPLPKAVIIGDQYDIVCKIDGKEGVIITDFLIGGGGDSIHIETVIIQSADNILKVDSSGIQPCLAIPTDAAVTLQDTWTNWEKCKFFKIKDQNIAYLILYNTTITADKTQANRESVTRYFVSDRDTADFIMYLAIDNKLNTIEIYYK